MPYKDPEKRKDSLSRSSKKYKGLHAEKILDYQREYRLNNIEKKKLWDRRATEKGVRFLSNVYVKNIMGKIGLKNPSQELVDIWRETLLVKRAVKKVQEALDERSI